MQYINVGGLITDFDGKPIQEGFTVKKAIVNQIGSANPSSGEEAVRMRKLAQELYDLKEDIWGLEDADETTVKNAVNANGSKYVALVQSLVWEAISNKVEKPEPKPVEVEMVVEAPE